ncbi:hypothetical protein [Caulobacter segnis]|uniref:hypothetical protein n=1 Tax=Caulobacter segnis TaxID=88688 RepID=UPI0028676EBE|nr:hypothetical protein [Caulobacter segnis]MDR6624854.1 hypothetical protein [Caulobacter segnis]
MGLNGGSHSRRAVMELSPAALTGLLAGALQAAGYGLYVRHALRAETRPNPASWLMFAYGTALVVVLEAAAGASWPMLLLPAVCAASSIFVAALAFLRGATLRDLDRADFLAFVLDVGCTLAYLAVWAARAGGLVRPDLFELAAVLLLAGAAGTSITSFIPILRGTYRAPDQERPWPWIVWTAAYGALALATLMASAPSALLIYPGINLLLHALVAALSVRRNVGALAAGHVAG